MRAPTFEGLPLWKVLTDIVVGALLTGLCLLPMLAIAVAIFLDSGRPILIHQRRIGRFGNEYLMWKFRTLPVGTPQVAKSELQQVGFQPTRVGRFLRRYSLDEVPQLFNVLTGEMSLVGPRPALYTQHDLVAMRQETGVLRVKPGLTGLAQVSGREDLDLADKVALDAQYVNQMNPLLDLSIALRTIGAVVRARGSF